MSLVKITFDGSSVTAKQDADLNHHLSGLVPAGIIRGLGSELSYSASNNYITFQDGYVQIYGRRIYVEAGTRVQISLNSFKYGYICITVNLTANTAIIGIVEGLSSYPTLTQQDLSKTGTIYQLPVCRYTKTTTSLTIDTSYERKFIEPALPTAQQALTKANGLALKKISVKELTYDQYTYETKKTVTLSLKGIPVNSIILFTFTTDDPWGYGGTLNTCGSVVYRYEDLRWNSNKFQIRDTQNKNWIDITITALGDDATITFGSTTNLPSVVFLTAYYIG